MIFISTISDAQYAVNYIKNHPGKSAKVFAQTIDCLLYLKNNGITSNHYYNLFYKNKQKYSLKIFTKIFLQNKILVKYLRSHFPPIETCGIRIIDVLQILLESEYAEVLHTYRLFTLIEKEWKPTRYLIPCNIQTITSSWEPRGFAAASIISDFFIKPSRRQLYGGNTNKKSHTTHLFAMVSNLGRILKMLYILIYKLFVIKKSFDRQKNIDFLLFSGGRNLYVYDSIFSSLKRINKLRYGVLSAQNNLDDEFLLQKSSIDYHQIDSLLTPELQKKIQKSNTFFAQKMHEFFAKPVVSQKIFPSLPFPIKKALLYKTRLTLEKYAYKFIRQTVLAQAAIEQTQPRLLITTHDPAPSALPFVYQAKKKYIPTLVLLHGYPNIYSEADHESDYFAGWGSLLTKQFIDVLHKKRNTLFEVGYPFLDAIFHQKRAFWQSNFREKPFSNPFRLSFLLTVYQYDTVAISQFLFDVFEAIAPFGKHYEIWVRTHPGQPVEGIERLAKYYGINLKFNSQMTIEKFVLQSDALITWDTTAIVWCMIFGKPLFYTSPWWGDGAMPARKYKAAWIVQNAQHLLKKITFLIKRPLLVKELRPGQKRFLKDLLGKIDGTSSSAHIELITNLLKKQR